MRSFITEGLIKLPPDILKEATSFFVEKLLAYMTHHGAKQADDELELEFFNTVLKKQAAKHKVALPSKAEAEKVGRSKIAQTILKFKVPESYLKSLERLHKQRGSSPLKELSIKYMVIFSGGHPELDGDESGMFIEDPPTVLLDLDNLGLSKAYFIPHVQVGDVAEIDRRIEYGVSVLEHELSHAVQLLVLQQLHPFQGSGKGSKGAVASDRTSYDEVYYTSQLEFDPQLKTSLKSFANLARKKGAKTLAAKKELLRKYTWDDVPRANIPIVTDKVVPERSPFFQSLKRVDPVKWKKALKLLTPRALAESLTEDIAKKLELMKLTGAIDEDVLRGMVKEDGYHITFNNVRLLVIMKQMRDKVTMMTGRTFTRCSDLLYSPKTKIIFGRFWIPVKPAGEARQVYDLVVIGEGTHDIDISDIQVKDETLAKLKKNPDVIDLNKVAGSKFDTDYREVREEAHRHGWVNVIELTTLENADEELLADLIHDESYVIMYRGRSLKSIKETMRQFVIMKTGRSMTRCKVFAYGLKDKELYAQYWTPVGSGELTSDRKAIVNLRQAHKTYNMALIDLDVYELVTKKPDEFIDLNKVMRADSSFHFKR